MNRKQKSQHSSTAALPACLKRVQVHRYTYNGSYIFEVAPGAHQLGVRKLSPSIPVNFSLVTNSTVLRTVSPRRILFIQLQFRARSMVRLPSPSPPMKQRTKPYPDHSSITRLLPNSKGFAHNLCLAAEQTHSVWSSLEDPPKVNSSFAGGHLENHKHSLYTKEAPYH